MWGGKRKEASRGMPLGVGRMGRSAAQAEVGDHLAVGFLVGALEVVQKLAAVVDHADEAVTGGVVLLVGLQVLGELLDALGERGDLHFAGAGVALVTAELLADGVFVDHGVCPLLWGVHLSQPPRTSGLARNGERILRHVAGKFG